MITHKSRVAQSGQQLARNDARAVEGLDSAIDRAKSSADAGANLIFPEALTDSAEFDAFRTAIDVPLMANMTEVGKSELLDTETLADIGVNVVIYPVTLLRLATGAVEQGLKELSGRGTPAQLVPRMQSRSRLEGLLGYDECESFDAAVLARFPDPKGG